MRTRTLAAPPATATPPDTEDSWDVWREPARPPLTGRPARVRPSGFKHLLVPLLAASCLADEPWLIGNVPDIADTRVLTALLGAAGAAVTHDRHARTLAVDARRLTGHRIADGRSRQPHGAVYLLPALLAATGRVVSGRHGGCRIGAGEHPLAHIAAVMERFGAVCDLDADGLRAVAPACGLRGAVIDLSDFARRERTTGTLTGPYYCGATKTALLLAAAAKGTTVLRGPYPKADVTELAHALGSAGVPLSAGAHEIVVEGRGGPVGGTGVRLPSDLMEVVTLISLAACLDTEADIALDRAPSVRAGLVPELAALARMGVPLTWDDDGVHVGRTDRIGPVDLVAASHLAHSAALPLLVPLLLRATGPSHLIDLVRGARHGYADGLRRLGARLSVDGARMTVHPSALRPHDGPLRAGDLRAVMALVLGALTTGGRHAVHGVRHLARGYDRLPWKLREFGAGIAVTGA